MSEADMLFQSSVACGTSNSLKPADAFYSRCFRLLPAIVTQNAAKLSAVREVMTLTTDTSCTISKAC